MNPIPIIEWRRYTLHPGQRDTLIALFDEQFLESQDEAGAAVLGQFRVDERPDLFIWLRGFASMEKRQEALMNFYSGTIWRDHREAANATMIDSDDVHLLTANLLAPAPGRPAKGSKTLPETRFMALVCRVKDPTQVERFAGGLHKFLLESGGDVVGGFSTLDAVNNFPALPVWADDPVHIALVRFANGDALRTWFRVLPPVLRDQLKTAPECLILHPTARSALR